MAEPMLEPMLKAADSADFLGPDEVACLVFFPTFFFLGIVDIRLF
jgi:hypothetical protein